MQLVVKKRTEFGKNTKKLRREFKVPGVVYGKDFDSTSITLDLNPFVKVYNEAGETNLIDLDIDGQKEKVLIKEVQVHPVNGGVLHVNFHKVNLKEKINASIPVEITGDEDHSLIESGEALVLPLLTAIEISALPTDLPNSFTVDISGLQEVGAALTIADLVYDKDKIELVGYEDDDLIVKLDYAVTEEAEEEELTEEEMIANLEVTGEKPAADDDEDSDEE